ncbi:MAG: leucine-rich repeat domain-containing protein [Acidobacteriota bacterium]
MIRAGDSSEIAKELTLASHGVERLDAGTFFGLDSLAPGSYLRVSTDGGAVAGLEFVRSAGGDLLGLNARKADEKLQNLFFPQMVASGPWKTELGLVNYSNAPQLVTVYAHKPDGTLYGAGDVTSNPVSRGLDPNQSLLLDVGQLFGFEAGDTREGWLEVRASAEAINGFLSYGVPSIGYLAAIAATPEATKASVFSHIAATSGYFTGLALLNPSSLTANVQILAYTPSGELLGRDDTVIRPNQRLSRLLTEFIPSTQNHSGGFVSVTSDVPLYTSSLFGADKVLANIPPQQPPPQYAPDQNLSRLSLTPLLAVVQPGKTQKFATTGASDPVTWSVNGIASGDSSVGTIDSTGLYKAPSDKPDPSVITVSAETGTLSGGASVDILTSQSLVSGLGVLQSVVYMQSLQRLYEVELSSLGTLAAGVSAAQTTAASNQSELFQVQPPNVKTSVQQYIDDIVKLISYPASNGKEYMLLLGQTSGQLIRLEPISGQSRIVYTGLNQPTSMALDAATGSVLVAESDRITQIARSFIESGLSSTSATSGQAAPDSAASLSTVASIAGATGLAIDRCTGEIYFSIASEGVIKAYDPATGTLRTLVSGLASPGQLLALYREGVPCPERTQLLVAEVGVGRITLVAPSLGSVVSWISAPGVRDLSFIPPDNPFNLATSVAYGLFFDQAGKISIVDVGDQYGTEPPVEEHPVCESQVTFEDANLEAPVTCTAAASLTTLDASGRNIHRVGGLEFFVNLEALDLSHNFIKSIAPVGSLTQLRELDASYNLITSPGLSANLTRLSTLDLSYNLIEDLSTLINLDIGSPGSPARVRARMAQALPALSELNLAFNAISELSPLSSLTSLTVLNLSGNFTIEDLTALSTLTNLQQLLVQWNLIRDLTPLSTLGALQLLDLRYNRVSLISPLLDNPGIGDGDRIFLANNPLDLSQCSIFETLRQRGVEFDIDPQCDVDLAVALSSPADEARFGDFALLEAVLSNLGASEARNLSLHVQLDPSLALRSAVGGGAVCTLGDGVVNCQLERLAPASSATVRIRAIVQKRTGVLTSTATVSAQQSELHTDNNQDTLTIPLASVDLEVTKTAEPASVYPGGELTYSITVANGGSSDATSVQVTDQLPSEFVQPYFSTSMGDCTFDSENRLLECQIGSLSAGASAEISVSGIVVSEPGELTNSATAASAETDSDPSNNTGSVVTPVVQPDLSITKTGSSDPAITGTSFTYTVTVVNNGTGAATNVTIIDNLQEDLQFEGYLLPGGSSSFVEGQLSCQLSSLAAGATAVLSIDTTVIGATSSILNTANVSEDQTDGNPDDNVFRRRRFPVRSEPVLRTDRVQPGNARVGEQYIRPDPGLLQR